MQRTVITIDEDACTGCGLCVTACHEGAIGMVNGKARLLRDDYCDGMGDCLPECPAGAISFEVREAAAYDEQAVRAAKAARAAHTTSVAPDVARVTETFEAPVIGGCPGARVRDLRAAKAAPADEPAPAADMRAADEPAPASQLAQWPCQIKLVPPTAPYFDGANLLVAADCTAFAFADLHRTLMAGRITLIGCPKLDAVDYADKLGAILAGNDVRSVVVARMEVPCCGGLTSAVERALVASGRQIPASCVTFGVDGTVLGMEPIAYDAVPTFDLAGGFTLSR